MLINFAMSDIETYYCKERTVVGVNFSLLFRLLKGVTQDDVVCIQLTNKGLARSVPQLHLYVVSENGCHRNNINMLIVQEVYYQPPDKEFDTIVSMPSNQLQKIFRNHEKSGTHIQVMCEGPKDDKNKPEQVYFITEGDDCNGFTKVGSQAVNDMDENSTSLYKSSDKTELYSLRSLMLIAKATNLSTFVQLYLASDYPLVMRYQIGTMGYIMFALAANVDESNIKLGSDELKGLVDANTIMSPDDEDKKDPTEDEGDECDEEEYDDEGDEGDEPAPSSPKLTRAITVKVANHAPKRKKCVQRPDNHAAKRTKAC